MSDTEDIRAQLAAAQAEIAALRAGTGPRSVVRLGGKEYGLVQIPSLADRWHVVINVARPGREDPAAWAALGLCHPEIRHEIAYTGDLLAYGRKVCEHLLASGVPMVDIQTAAASAYALVTSGIPNVGGASDFSATSPAGSDGEAGSSVPSSK